MPNPLVNAAFRGKKNRTKAPQDHEEPTEPEIIGAAVQVFPYRGTEDHGVPTKGIYTPLPDFSDTEFAEYEPESPQPDPVPVRIVSQGAKELRRWTTHYVMAGSSPSLLLSRREDRTSARLKNEGGVTILLAPENSISVATGYKLAPGEEFTTNGESEVWGIVQPGANPIGGWINLVPRQTVNGAVQVAGPVISTRGLTTMRLVYRVYSVSGTTISTQTILLGVNQDGVSMSGTALATTANIGTTTQGVHTLVNPLAVDNIQALLSTLGSSGDAVINADVWGYFLPDNGTRDTSQSLVRVYQEITVKE
jgi:hypothetical protein